MTNVPRTRVQMRWGLQIPMRDGVVLSATLYTRDDQSRPSPCVCTLTPYTAQNYHEHAVYFASHGYPFLSVDVRGRGNSGGEFRPFIQEAQDGYDAVNWVASQDFCDGKVAMWGGSYAGHNQWMTAAGTPDCLRTIVPVASPTLGLDMPLSKNIPSPYLVKWLTLVAGRTLQDKVFGDRAFWGERFAEAFETGVPFKDLDEFLGNPSRTFQEWMAHPEQGVYWDQYNPTPRQYQNIAIPVLTITGAHDGNQPGALEHYRAHLRNATPEAQSQHYLVIGPWDHEGTRVPKLEFSGIRVGPGSLIDLGRLHLEWYAWVLQGGPRPAFLKRNVAYYVLGSDIWRYTDTLESVTAHHAARFLHPPRHPLEPGHLEGEPPTDSAPERYTYDPRDVSHAALESTVDPDSRVERRLFEAGAGRQLVYESEPFGEDVEISGFFRLEVWLSIDALDTDFRVSIYEIDIRGGLTLITFDWMRARYRQNLREGRLVNTTEPLRYDFERFLFVSRRCPKGSRLGLVVGPVNSIYRQKNYNSGATVADETLADARAVTVRLHHDAAHPSVLYIPYGQTAT